MLLPCSVRRPGEVRPAAATPGGEPGPARGVPGAAPASGAGHVRPPEVDLDTEKPVADRNGQSPWRVAQDAASVRARGTIGRVPAAGLARAVRRSMECGRPVHASFLSANGR